MSEQDYYDAIRALGLTPTGQYTVLTEVWRDGFGNDWMVPKASTLSPDDRTETVARLRKMLGLDDDHGPH